MLTLSFPSIIKTVAVADKALNVTVINSVFLDNRLELTAYLTKQLEHKVDTFKKAQENSWLALVTCSVQADKNYYLFAELKNIEVLPVKVEEEGILKMSTTATGTGIIREVKEPSDRLSVLKMSVRSTMKDTKTFRVEVLLNPNYAKAMNIAEGQTMSFTGEFNSNEYENKDGKTVVTYKVPYPSISTIKVGESNYTTKKKTNAEFEPSGSAVSDDILDSF